MSAKPATTYLGTRSHFRRRLKAGPFKDGHYRNLLKRSLSHSQKEVLHRRQQLAKKTSKRSVNILFLHRYEINLLFSEKKGFKVVHQLEDRWPRQIRICSRFLFENTAKWLLLNKKLWRNFTCSLFCITTFCVQFYCSSSSSTFPHASPDSHINRGPEE